MALTTDRARQLTYAAIAVIAGQGMRALTHRAVDTAAQVPPGTTSNYFRSRRELLRGVLTRIADQNAERLSEADSRPPGEDGGDPDALARRIARFVDDQLTVRRASTLARMACEIEVAADPDLREILHVGAPFPALARAALEQLGVPDAERAAAGLIAVVDGLQYDRLVGVGSLTAAPAGTPQARAEVATVVRAYLDGLIAARP